MWRWLMVAGVVGMEVAEVTVAVAATWVAEDIIAEVDITVAVAITTMAAAVITTAADTMVVGIMEAAWVESACSTGADSVIRDTVVITADTRGMVMVATAIPNRFIRHRSIANLFTPNRFTRTQSIPAVLKS